MESIDRLFLYRVGGLLLVYVVYLCVSCGQSESSPPEPRLYRGAYEPVYVQLNNEQFERLIEVLTGDKHDN